MQAQCKGRAFLDVMLLVRDGGASHSGSGRGISDKSR